MRGSKGSEDQMVIERDRDGVIRNARSLTVDEVVRQRVLCPSCREKIFEIWPYGWDAHAATKCSGLRGITEQTRKLQFKETWRYLFR